MFVKHDNNAQHDKQHHANEFCQCKGHRNARNVVQEQIGQGRVFVLVLNMRNAAQS